MDTIRTAEKAAVANAGSDSGPPVLAEARSERVALFTDIALGDAP
jgi:hypothetical protein